MRHGGRVPNYYRVMPHPLLSASIRVLNFDGDLEIRAFSGRSIPVAGVWGYSVCSVNAKCPGLNTGRLVGANALEVNVRKEAQF
jgi:hypothetical protein